LLPLLREAVERDEPLLRFLLLRELPLPLRELLDFARVAVDLPFEELAPFRDFEPPPEDAREELAEDDFRCCPLGDALLDDERVLA